MKGSSALTGRTVLHLVTTLDRGGAEHALLHLCRSLGQVADRGWRAEVAYLKGPGELTSQFEAAGVPVHRLRLTGLGGVGAYGRARRLVRDLAPDVVHTHLFKADCLGAAVVGRHREGRTVLVSTKHNEDAYLARSAAIRQVGRRVARRADAVVAITDGVARFLREWLGDAAGSVETIRYGVPAPVRTGDGSAFRKKLRISPKDFVLLCVGRLVEQKDPHTLVSAMCQLIGEIPFRLVFLGRGPMEKELRSAAGGLDVTFAGFEEDPTDAYAAADLVVLSSRYEGLGLVLVEAAYHGKAVVATNVGGIPEAVEDGVTGVLVPPGDPKAMAAAIFELGWETELRERMGRAARERVGVAFSTEACLTKTLALYERLIGERR